MKQQRQSSAVLLFFFFFSISVILMAESEETGASVHIVYTQRPREGDDDVEAYHLRTLSTVLGSEETARESLIYVYKTAACGFSAKLTPAQVEQLSKMPVVLQVVRSQTVQLHRGIGGIHLGSKREGLLHMT